jgi:Leucine-rich repeat (LRR) protein
MNTLRPSKKDHAGGHAMKKIISTAIILWVFLVPALTALSASFNVVDYGDNELSNFSIYAIEQVQILRNCIIYSGDVGVASAGIEQQLCSDAEESSDTDVSGDTEESTEARGPLDSDESFVTAVVVDQDVYFECDTSIYGEQVKIRRGASVNNVYYYDLINEGEIRGEEGFYDEHAPQVYLPDFPQMQPGTEDVSVYWGETVSLEPGHYSNVNVKTFGTLVLTGGTYHMENLELGYYNSRILVQKPSEIVISGQLFTWIKSFIGPDEGCELGGKDICIYVGGTNGGSRYLRNFPKAVQIGRYGKLFANIFAPNGTIWIQGDCVVKGAFVGKDVLVGYGVSITLDAAKPQHVVTYFADPNLEAAVRDAINKLAGDIYTTDLENLQALNASGREISDLTGIEDCVGLTTLVLSYNKITDITPLAACGNLITLNLNENDIADLSPLAGLLNLTRLYLGDNSISDAALQHLSGLTNLTTLVLDYNSISDLKPLQQLTKLTCLVLNDNYVEDLTPLTELKELAVLYLYNNQISDLEPLRNLAELATLYLYDNNVSNVEPLSALTRLTNLVLDYNQIEDISPLANLKNLVTLYLNDNSISDITALVGLENLTTLILNTNRISSIAPISELKNICYLNLGYNGIHDIAPLEGLMNLSFLYLNNNEIGSIKALVRNCDAGGLGEGDVVYLNTNPLDDEDMESDISYLSSKGICVYWSELP